MLGRGQSRRWHELEWERKKRRDRREDSWFCLVFAKMLKGMRWRRIIDDAAADVEGDGLKLELMNRCRGLQPMTLRGSLWSWAAGKDMDVKVEFEEVKETKLLRYSSDVVRAYQIWI